MDRGIIFKSGTTLAGAHPKIRRAIYVARRVLNRHGARCVVTSLWNGIHGEDSFHHYGMAVDLRSKEIRSKATKDDVLADLEKELGDEYEVFLEARGLANEHYHIEWQAGYSVREEWLAEVFWVPES